MKYPLLEMKGIMLHLFAERYCHHFEYTSVIVDKEGDTATFLFYDLLGRMRGYQRYNPYGDKDKRNDGVGKYYTYSNEFCVWGAESIEPGKPLVLVEGVMDACILHVMGFSALAILSHTPPKWFMQYVKKVLSYQHPCIIHIKDGDGMGKNIPANFNLTCPEGHDMNSLGLEKGRKFLIDNGVPMPDNQLRMFMKRFK